MLNRKIAIIIAVVVVLVILKRYVSYQAVHGIFGIYDPSMANPNGMTARTHENRQEYLLEKCALANKNRSKEIVLDEMMLYLGFLIRSQSLFYCAVPKVMTRTLLQYITYLHVMRELVPAIQNPETSLLPPKLRKVRWRSVAYLKEHGLISKELQYAFKNISRVDSVEYLSRFVKYATSSNQDTFNEANVWRSYYHQLFPLIRLSNGYLGSGSLFSTNFTRAIFVRHPFERLASAYTDKILVNQKEPRYRTVRRYICQLFPSFYLSKSSKTSGQQNPSSKYSSDPCQSKPMKFEHFVEHVVLDQWPDNPHWSPYSALCQPCRLRYNFIGKYETIQQDLLHFRSILNLLDERWDRGKKFRSGGTLEGYKALYVDLPTKLICALARFYRDDFTLFDYRIEDFLPASRKIKC